MGKRKLTDRGVKALKPAKGGTLYDVMDAVVPAFGVRVSETGLDMPKIPLISYLAARVPLIPCFPYPWHNWHQDQQPPNLFLACMVPVDQEYCCSPYCCCHLLLLLPLLLSALPGVPGSFHCVSLQQQQQQQQ